MILSFAHRLRKVVRNAPNLLRGYNIHVDADKLRLIDHVYNVVSPAAKSFVDLGGIWKVNGAYTLYTLRKHDVTSGIVVDTDYPPSVEDKLSRISRLQVLRGDFTTQDMIHSIGRVDVAYFFDVLLHQANPSWDQVLTTYSTVAPCLVVYNQQYVQGERSIRLTQLPLEQYLTLAPPQEAVYRYAYEHASELHPVYQKPWLDIHNIFQWAITDRDLCDVMSQLGFQKVYFRNYGRFSNLPAYENHAFIFVRNQRINSL